VRVRIASGNRQGQKFTKHIGESDRDDVDLPAEDLPRNEIAGNAVERTDVTVARMQAMSGRFDTRGWMHSLSDWIE